jgi:hypothetical protein
MLGGREITCEEKTNDGQVPGKASHVNFPFAILAGITIFQLI